MIFQQAYLNKLIVLLIFFLKHQDIFQMTDHGTSGGHFENCAGCTIYILFTGRGWVWTMAMSPCMGMVSYPNGPEAGREAGWGSEFVPLKKREVGSFILLHKISRTPCGFGIRTFLKQYNCYESATIWYTDHQYLAQYVQRNNQQSVRNTSYILQLCCALVWETSTQCLWPRHRLKCVNHCK